MFDALIKVGGSLYHHPNLASVAAAWANLAQTHRLLFLPGGGPFADQVRTADARFTLSDDAAHWMAILAMDQYAYLLADLIPQAVITRNLVTAAAVSATGQTAMLAPSTLLLQLDPLPHSWQVTSDSIAVWLTGYAEIDLLVLLKSVAGVYQTGQDGESLRLLEQVSPQDLSRYKLVDSYFGPALPQATSCWLIDGGQPERLAELLRCGQTMGTQVIAGV